MSQPEQNQKDEVVVTKINFSNFVDKFRKIFWDEIPYSKEVYALIYGVSHQELDSSYAQHLRDFPEEGALASAVESVTHFLDRCMHRKLIEDYELEVITEKMDENTDLIKEIVFNITLIGSDRAIKVDMGLLAGGKRV